MAREILLTKGKVAFVDDGDFAWLSQFSWHASVSKSGRCYAGTWDCSGGCRTYVLMHRLIVGATKGQLVDHADGNGLNNQRFNIRLCTSAENQYNKAISSNNTSGFKGVSLFRPTGQWRASIQHEGKRHYLGYFNTPEDAARAYDAHAIELNGKFAKLNFPQGGNHGTL